MEINLSIAKHPCQDHQVEAAEDEIPAITVKDKKSIDHSEVVGRLWIIDLLKLPFIVHKNTFLLDDKWSIKNVFVFGTIVDVREMTGDRVLYKLDDGTATIMCFQKLSEAKQSMKILNYYLNKKPSNIENNRSVAETSLVSEHNVKYAGAVTEFQKILRHKFLSLQKKIPYSVADTVCVSGDLFQWNGENQIHIFKSRLIEDPNEEADIMGEIALWYEQFRKLK